MLGSTILLVTGLVASSMANPIVEKRGSCTFTDAAAAAKGKGSCSTIILKDIKVPAGQTLDLTKLKDNTHVTFQGKTTFGYKEWEGPLISFSGNGLVVEGAAGHSIDAEGQRWWDTKGSNGGKKKPKFFFAHSMKNSAINKLNVKNTPVQAFSINGCTNVKLNNINLDNSLGDTKGGHNTDAFDVGSSTGVYIAGAIVKNQDDCLAINSGTDISFTDGNCSGGHGISIGSVGGRSNNVVKKVRVLNSVISNSDNGVRIKTVSGATGSVSDVVYDHITLKNIHKNGIVIQQDYQNGKPTGKPTAGVPITGVTISNVVGNVDAKGTDVYILCASCTNWTWKGNKITGGKTSTACKGVPSGASC